MWFYIFYSHLLILLFYSNLRFYVIPAAPHMNASKKKSGFRKILILIMTYHQHPNYRDAFDSRFQYRASVFSSPRSTTRSRLVHIRSLWTLEFCYVIRHSHGHPLRHSLYVQINLSAILFWKLICLHARLTVLNLSSMAFHGLEI